MTLMEKEILEQPKALAGIKAKNEKVIKDLCAAIKAKDVKFCYFAARGTSDHASIYAQYLFANYIGIPSGLALPSAVTAYDGKLCLKDALVIGVSQSGKAADALAVMDRAKKCGAITVAVTNDESSPMAQFADYHLFCGAGEEVSVAATKTFTAQMYVLALLCAEWSGNKEFAERLAKVPETLGEYMPELGKSIDKIISRYRYMSDGFVLGRGYNYAIALENGLKLKETNYVRMQGAAISDFHHGPFAQIEEGSPVIIYVDQGPLYDDSVAMVKKLQGAGADVLLVTDDKALKKLNKLCIVTPSLGSDDVSVYFNAVFAQLFACKLTAVKGRNPDQPRNLKKVTITK